MWRTEMKTLISRAHTEPLAVIPSASNNSLPCSIIQTQTVTLKGWIGCSVLQTHLCQYGSATVQFNVVYKASTQEEWRTDCVVGFNMNVTQETGCLCLSPFPNLTQQM